MLAGALPAFVEQTLEPLEILRSLVHSTHVNLRRRVSDTATQQMWICESCGFIYDPAEGDPDGGIPPGTAFEDIPDDWMCPVCGARKRDFSPYE